MTPTTPTIAHPIGRARAGVRATCAHLAAVGDELDVGHCELVALQDRSQVGVTLFRDQVQLL